MSTPLLATKFHIPQPRARLVPRRRLTEILRSGVKRPGGFILLSGPAGFGKTTLLGEFVAEFRQPLAWLSLDELDNDPARFWAYLIAACQSVQPGVGEAGRALLQSPQPLPDETLPTILINDLVRLGDDLVLVLDDYHTIQNQAIHAALAFLLDHLPDNLHLVISTRLDPPWSLARFRARAQLIEIRAADLRFTTDEAAAFLNQVMGLDLGAEDIAALEARTEGWIASLQLAALSMKGHRDVTGFIKAFTGSHVYVAEYLIEEVLGRQPEEIRNFLMQTSILERLSADLCEAVSGHAQSPVLLKDLYQANLFLLPLDGEGSWYRYHQLFRDLLRARLGQTFGGDAIAGLHRHAAEWYAQTGMLPEAIEHALSSRDFPYAAQLIEKAAMPMILNAYFRTVEKWLQVIPPEYLKESLRANLAFAWMHLMRQKFAQAGPYLERLQELFTTTSEDRFDASLQGEWLALQSMLLSVQGRVAESTELAERALKILPAEDAQVRSMTYMGLANMYQQMLDYDRAAQLMNAIVEHARTMDDLASEILGVSLLGRMRLQQGSLLFVYEITFPLLQRIEQAGLFSPFSATLYGELAQVYYHWHELDEARRHFARSVELSVLGGFSDAEIYHSVFLSRLLQMQGHLQASTQEIEKALDLMRSAAPAFVREEVIAQQVSISLATGHLAAAQAALKEYGFSFEDTFSYPELPPDAAIQHTTGLLYNSALRTLLYRAREKRAQQDLEPGIELAGRVIESSLRPRHLPLVLQTLLLRAQLQLALGDEQAGLADVAKALELAAPEGFISVFAEEGASIAEALDLLLERNLPGSVGPTYVWKILSAFPGKDAEVLPAQRTAVDDEPLIEPLTARELEVLRHIAAGDSNQVIADKLVVTLSAVKKHTGNIFRKLNVNSCTQALVRAQELGLFD
jgi:LuxR family maltose regulon positive regulatory protein